MNEILFALWFFAPAGIANSAPVFANKIPLLKNLGMPIDCGKTFRGKRIFGDHKTLRGFLVGILAGMVVGLIQFILFRNFSWISDFTGTIAYNHPATILFGGLLGFGALAGDSVKSFFKRQVGVKSGQSWFPFDQIDYIIGGLIVATPFVGLDFRQYLIIFLVWFLIHPIATFIGWLLKLKDSPI